MFFRQLQRIIETTRFKIRVHYSELINYSILKFFYKIGSLFNAEALMGVQTSLNGTLAQAVWPDLAKFRQFGNNMEIFGQFLKA